MKYLPYAVLFTFSWLLVAPLAAQPQIGGGTCNASSLSGTYAFSLTGRQVTSSGKFSNVLQANGSATFDGQSIITMSLTSDTTSAVAAPLPWSGTYTVQANCVGIANITTGGNVTLNLMLYNKGFDFLATGSDATYSYAGTGITQPTVCSASTLSGVYTFNGSGFALAGGSVNGFGDAVGLLQFDGLGALTVNISMSSAGKAASPLALTGSYMVGSDCLGSATVTDSMANSYVMSFGVYFANKVVGTDFYATLAQGSAFQLSGGGHAIYGQPTATAAAVSSTARSGE